MGHAGEPTANASTRREARFDLLIVGFVGYSNVFGRIIRGTTQNLSRLSPCTVMIVN